MRTYLVTPLALVVVGAAAAGCSQPRASSAIVAGSNPAQGKEYLEGFGCGSCHTIPGIRVAKGVVGPPLTAFGQRAFIAGEVPNNAENLIRWIMNPQSIEPGTAMPNLGVSNPVARDMAAYLYTLR